MCHIPRGTFVLIARGEELSGLGAGVAELLGDGLVGVLVHALGHYHSQPPATGGRAPEVVSYEGG